MEKLSEIILVIVIGGIALSLCIYFAKASVRFIERTGTPSFIILVHDMIITIFVTDFIFSFKMFKEMAVWANKHDDYTILQLILGLEILVIAVAVTVRIVMEIIDYFISFIEWLFKRKNKKQKRGNRK